DVHIVRKVQLYPLQAGFFTIDAMEIQNKVRFSKSAVNKKAEQEIIQGGVPDIDIVEDGNTTIVESSMSTEPVAISVKPTPQKNKPLEYSGATGNFKLAAWLGKNELAKNEESEFIIAISGKGNFTQLSPPVFNWPPGIEGFEPTVIDSLDYTQSPMNGKREFHFRFVSAKPGNYNLPIVSFSFFNPDTNNYKTISTQPENVKITNIENPLEKIEEKNIEADKQKKYRGWWLAGTAVLATIIFFVVRAKRNKKVISLLPSKENMASLPTVAELLQPANIFSGADDKTFYNILRNCIWNFFTTHFGLKGSNLNKFSLSTAMQQKNIAEKNKLEILEILEQCDNGVFTNLDDAGDKHKLLGETTAVLEKIHDQINQNIIGGLVK
ncbi:MAG: BatD family protein, partial [Chitinophagaceae bacterium]